MPTAAVGVAVYATRVLARGNLTLDAVIFVEMQVDRAADEVTATSSTSSPSMTW